MLEINSKYIEKFTSISEVLEYRALVSPEKIAYTFLENGLEDELNLTYKELHNSACSIANRLLTDFKSGDRIVLFFPPGVDFIKAFFGCLYAGMIAVPSYPPKMNRSADRMKGVLEDASPVAILTVSGIGYEKVLSKVDTIDCSIIYLDKIDTNKNSTRPQMEIPTEVAFLQYTSGSTGAPKGVIVSHKNLMDNQQQIKQSFQLHEVSILVGWLPFYHDMGLVGNILQSVYSGFRAILFPPVQFLRTPELWLQAISKYKATVSGGPNFAYDLCVKNVDESVLKELDLRSWITAFNGAEPILLDTINDFAERFKISGFNKSSFVPCYGMAETTLLVSSKGANKPIVTKKFTEYQLQFNIEEKGASLEKRELVSCGEVVNGFDIKIIGENGREVNEGYVGEICLQGKSISKGYWQNSEETKKHFQNKIEGAQGLFFKTGDLGLLHKNQLYIAGRLKDILIIHGKNYYPQDIEEVASKSHENIIFGSVAVFSVLINNKESIVVVAECVLSKEINVSGVIQSVHSEIFDVYKLSVYDIVLIRRGALLKTSSGKIQRRGNKEAYLKNNLRKIGSFLDLKKNKRPIKQEPIVDISNTKKKIQDFFQVELNLEQQIKKNQNLLEFGLDSISLTRLVFFIEDEFGKEIPLEQIYSHSTIDELALLIDNYEVNITDEEENNQEKVRASYLQQSIWINQQRDLLNSGYHITVKKKLKGSLDSEKVQEAFQYLIDKYDVLKTIFEFEKETLYQKIQKDYKVNIDVCELVDETSKDQYIKDFSRTPFSLEKGPLLRITCLCVNSKEFTVVFVIHHILVDGKSVSLLLNEFHKLYDALSKDQQSLIVSSPQNNFKDFCQEEFIFDKDLLKKQKQFWKQQLGSAQVPLELPKKTSNSIDKTAASILFSIEKMELLAIKDYVKRERINLFSFLLSGYYVLLNRLSGNDIITIGTPVSLREKKKYEEAIGLFINSVMLKTSIKKDENLSMFVKKVYNQTRASLQYASYPFQKILEDLEVGIDENRLGLSTVFFNFMNNQENNLVVESLEAVYGINPGVDLNFDLNLYAQPTDTKIEFRLDYKSADFSQEAIQNIVFFYKYILSDIVHVPDSLIREKKYESIVNKRIPVIRNHELFSEKERELSVWQKFKQVAQSNSKSIAIKGIEREYSYEEVYIHANNIATYIENGKAENIGLCFGHHEHMIVGMLAILKTGNAYVPVDLTLPDDRKEYIIKDAEIQRVLTDSSNYNQVRKLVTTLNISVDIVIIDQLKTQDVIESNELIITNSETRAYILYTSGSTGLPKGVIQTQQYIMHIAYSFINSLKICPEDCISLIPTFNFSASMMDTFGALLSGASIKIIDIKSEGISGMLETISKSKVTIYHSVPTVFRSMIEEVTVVEDKKKYLKNVRLIYLAGEPLLRDDVISYQKIFNKNSILVNGLGCTEFNICSQNFIDKKTEITSPYVSLGHNGLDIEVIILDNDQTPVDVLVEGEIALKSRYLSKGYWKLPELTKQKFITIDGEQFYLTGDLGKRLPDGELIHLGRKDFQVKLRGQRIELGEIESQLLKIDGIKSAVVVLKELHQEDYELCAYYISDSDIVFEESFLKKQLSSFLPSYMLPKYYKQLEKFPLTTTGKVDRVKLPIPIQLPKKRVNIESVQKTKEALKLVKIWGEVLRCDFESIENDSDFFQLGGDSLKALQVFSRVREVYKVEIGLQFIFEHSEFRDMLDSISKLQTTETVKINKSPLSNDHPLTPGQYSIWIYSQFKDASIAYNLTGAYKINGKLDISILKLAIRRLYEKYAVLRTNFYEKDGSPVMRVKEKYSNLSEIVQLRKTNSEYVSELLRQHHHRIIDLVKDELCTFEIIEIEGNQEFYLSYNIHHIIADGWSSGVLVAEVLKTYKEIKEDTFKEVSLDIQFFDYSYWYNQHIELLHESKVYWQQQLKDYPKPTQWLNNVVSKETSFEGSEMNFEFDINQTNTLKKIAEEEHCTLFMVVLSLINICLYKYSNQEDIIVGTDFSGRNLGELENQLGYFLKLIPVRTQINKEFTFSEYLSIVKTTVLDAFDNQDYPIEYMIKDIEKDSSDRKTFFNTLILFQNFNNIPDFKNYVSDLDITQIPTNNANALLDLTFEFLQIEDRLELKIRYKTEVFEAWQIEGFWNQFNTLIESVGEKKNEKIKTLHIEKQSLETPIRAKVNYPCVIDAISKIAKQNPHKLALHCNDRNLSYQQLYDRVNQLASFLKRDIGSKEYVGIFMKKDENAIITILAILKSNCVFVPIDIHYPKARIQHVIKDANIKHVICDISTSKELSEFNTSVNILEIEQVYNKPIIKDVKFEDCKEDELAYILYTSGSTGTPKGVMIDRRSLNYYTSTFLNYFKLTAEDRVLQQASLSFDTSIEEIFPALCIGATLDIIEEGGKDIVSIVKAVENHAVTVISSTPMIINELNAYTFNQNKLRLLISGGDVLKESHISNFIGKMPIYNTYGPTETTVCASYKKVEVKEDLKSIGKPIEGKQITIVDTNGFILPNGVEGEICIGGEGIFKGYVNDKNQTDNALVLLKENGVFYKSGDRGYIDNKGEVIFKGRVDNQIKIRGQRVSLQEVEDAVLLDTTVKNAFISAQLDDKEKLDIIAHVESKDSFEFQMFLDRLSQKLPQYMIPKRFYKVEKFPINVNGKISIEKLLSNQYPQIKLEDIFIVPKNDIQEKILEIWKSVLKQEHISITSNFFHIGGDSLLLGKIKMELEICFSTELSFKELYEANTIQLSSELFAKKSRTQIEIGRKEFII
ncbi:non-ribosomal peptide synthetase [Flavobacterium daejeonense]|uniref:non-ribosomal peptide synthetase n=1 Tax=Flavobacterium daejeonense TaxID=350893 RepID=UPI00047D3204|nr:non-ribosomal peptide synthetase [Flavobacterium daejeonense]